MFENLTKNNKKNLVEQNETLSELGISVFSETFFQFNNQNYLLKLSRTVENETRTLNYL